MPELQDILKECGLPAGACGAALLLPPGQGGMYADGSN